MTRRNFVFGGIVLAASVVSVAAHAGELERRTWMIEGQEREALVSKPVDSRPAAAHHPVVLVFHGHGGTMRHAARTMPIHDLWPDAIVVFPQGLPTVGRLTDPEGKKSGWQREVGDQADRDLKLVDSILATLRASSRVDERRLYATGHSNGGAFTYLLWAERGKTFAAFAPSAAVLARGAGKLEPRPVLHLGSPQDPLVKFAWQTRMIDHVLAVNTCGPRRPDAQGYVVYEPSAASGAQVATFLHDGGHAYPEAGPDLIVKFFQAHALP